MDSPRPEVQALLDGGVLWEGLGYGEDGGLGSTRVRYLLRIAAVEEEPTAGLASGAVTAVRATIVAGAAAVTAEGGIIYWRCGDGKSSWVGAAGMGRGGTAHSRSKNGASTSLHHVRAREGEEMERGASETGNRM